jgi:hypothetical protein
MSILRRLKDYLEREKVPYEVLTHGEAYTAPELAQALHVPGRSWPRWSRFTCLPRRPRPVSEMGGQIPKRERRISCTGETHWLHSDS